MRALHTTLDMPAERCRSTALDGRHHLRLVEADVTGVGAAPRRPMVAEDIRDLQLWTGHCGGLRRRHRFPVDGLHSSGRSLSVANVTSSVPLNHLGEQVMY
jgi:hypothetical protein